jgi:hypothetical protein
VTNDRLTPSEIVNIARFVAEVRSVGALEYVNSLPPLTEVEVPRSVLELLVEISAWSDVCGVDEDAAEKFARLLLHWHRRTPRPLNPTR